MVGPGKCSDIAGQRHTSVDDQESPTIWSLASISMANNYFLPPLNERSLPGIGRNSSERKLIRLRTGGAGFNPTNES